MFNFYPGLPHMSLHCYTYANGVTLSYWSQKPLKPLKDEGWVLIKVSISLRVAHIKSPHHPYIDGLLPTHLMENLGSFPLWNLVTTLVFVVGYL